MKMYTNMMELIRKFDIKKHIIYVVLLVGALIMYIGSGVFSVENQPKYTQEQQSKSEYINELEKRLTDTVSQINGVGAVQVMITLKNSKEVVVATEQKETEQSTVDGERKNTNFNKESKLVTVNQQPLVVKEVEPTLEGVIIIAEGAGNDSVKMQVTNAARVLLGLESHKIAVFQLKKGGK